VRRYLHRDLLRAVASLASSLERARWGRGPALGLPKFVAPFSLAGVARTALDAATEHRNTGVTLPDLVNLCGAYFNIEDPELRNPPAVERATRLMTRVIYEQAVAQQPPMLNLGRTIVLLGDHAAGVPGAVSESEWETELGVSLDGFMRLGFTLYTAALDNNGALARQQITRSDLGPVFEPLTGEQALVVIDRHLAGPPDWHRRWLAERRQLGQERPGYEKWSPNPLQARPLVILAGDLVVPAPHYVIERITPTGLYFTGQESFGERFTNALGTMFQNYVGEQLRLLRHGQVEPEISYDKGQRRSADWFLVFPEVVVVIEVKTARPTTAFRAGMSDGFDDARAKIGKARDQIIESARLVADGHPHFAHIPADRPCIGLIVTLEPFYVEEIFLGENLLASPTVPITAIPAYELEHLVGQLAHQVDAGQRLFGALGDTATSARNAVRAAAAGLPNAENEIIARAWDRWAVWPGSQGLDAAPAP
jgi:hypothetical protein